jgi:hypothetical protein
MRSEIFAKSSGKIFAKIEWKDTSKNPTGSKNIQAKTHRKLKQLPLRMIWTW